LAVPCSSELFPLDMAKPKRKIIFLKPTTLAKEESTRERELDRATARAHSASVSFRASHKYKSAKATDPLIQDHGLRVQAEGMRRYRAPRVSQSVSPTSLLLEGNSDPFEAFPVQITPRVNEALSFFRTHYLPATYGRQSLQTRSSAEELEWQAFINCMHDECSAFAFVFLQSVNVSPCHAGVSRPDFCSFC
jgi:hypothetical protein